MGNKNSKWVRPIVKYFFVFVSRFNPSVGVEDILGSLQKLQLSHLKCFDGKLNSTLTVTFVEM